MPFTLKTPQEIRVEIAQRAKRNRLTLNLTQAGLEKRSGVSLGSIKRFEKTGHIALDALLRIALVLDRLHEYDTLFAISPTDSLPSLDEIMKEPTKRKRGRES